LLNVLIAIALGFACLATTVFPAVYSAVAPWWRYTLGRLLFGLAATPALLVDFTLLQAITHPYPWMPYAALVLFASLGVHMTGLTIHLIRIQHKARRSTPEERVLGEE